MSMRKVVARAWTDPAYKAKLLSDPHSALAEAGVDVPVGIRLKVVEDTVETKHFVLPAAPADAAELSAEELAEVAGGIGTSQQQMGDPCYGKLYNW
jgi:Nitrile hydratase, alpha chain